ncbi:DinB family protein [Virgibacillus sp. LDC1]|uniref:DNA damage-inducible protein DinB n=1 Tax=Paenibacillus apis TaxID=1792174 RepID=A0A919Y5H2_9BACL|nr:MULTISPECIES: DinB family protein [Paenibacillus]MCV4230533.1 DinB family protein [Virgibacillus sp. LDC1]GIO42783.1 DNA damage-inducible protein DinB [Paenibacillus apis]
MKSLILYNWEVRDEYIKAFSSLSKEELFKDRNAGLGTIIKTLLHIIDVEYSWIRAMNKKPDISINLDEYKDLPEVLELSNQLRVEIKEYINQWNDNLENDRVEPSWMEESFRKGEIFRHILVHEVHHIGQLSIWARELGIEPISSNFIGRDIFNKLKNM